MAYLQYITVVAYLQYITVAKNHNNLKKLCGSASEILAGHVIIWTNGPTKKIKINQYHWAVLPTQSQLSHTDQPDMKLTYSHVSTRIHTQITHTHHAHILTLFSHHHAHAYTFSPIQNCANLYKNKSTPPDSLCAVCTFCMCVCVCVCCAVE